VSPKNDKNKNLNGSRLVVMTSNYVIHSRFTNSPQTKYPVTKSLK